MLATGPTLLWKLTSAPASSSIARSRADRQNTEVERTTCSHQDELPHIFRDDLGKCRKVCVWVGTCFQEVPNNRLVSSPTCCAQSSGGGKTNRTEIDVCSLSNQSLNRFHSASTTLCDQIHTEADSLQKIRVRKQSTIDCKTERRFARWKCHKILLQCKVRSKEFEIQPLRLKQLDRDKDIHCLEKLRLFEADAVRQRNKSSTAQAFSRPEYNVMSTISSHKYDKPGPLSGCLCPRHA